MMEAVHVIGASGRSGLALCRALLARGVPVVPVVRSAARMAATGLDIMPRIANLTGPRETLAAALAGATRIASTAHARHVPAILAASPAEARLICLGSTRKFTRWPDDHGNGVLRGEQALLASGRRGVILHPTMIYGAQGEDNVQRLAALLARLPIIPLPAGGRALVQPIHQEDVTASLLAALDIDWQRAESLVIAGPHAVAYREFVQSVARHAALSPRRILPVPVGPLMIASRVARLLPFLPRIGPDEIRRLTENKNFDIAPMRERLGLEPMTLDRGLARLFG